MIHKKSLISLIFFGVLIGCGDGATRILTQVPLDDDNIIIVHGSNPVDYIIPALSLEYKEKFLDAINQARGKGYNCGTASEEDGGKFIGYKEPSSPLVWNDSLYNAAYEHNYDMVNSQIFAHEGSGTKYDITGIYLNRKSLPEDRIRDNGYAIHAISSYIVG